MKVNWGIIKFIVVTGVIVFLFGFTSKRNKSRNLTKINVEFLDENEPFITMQSVNKLLIQNHDSVTAVGKEALVLKEAELRLQQNDMIREAQVYVSVDGVLQAKIEQRNPIARVVANTSYYIDEDGKKMPLSRVYSARVPIVTGITKEQIATITPLLNKIQEDSFFKQSIVGLKIAKDGIIVFEMRKMGFDVEFGKPDDVDRKFQNFKAFYQKTTQDKTLQDYRLVDLKFGNQVVATKR